MANSNNRVIHFEVQADDIERAKTFYKKVFNWKIEKMMENDPTQEVEGMDYWGITTGSDSARGINGGMYERPADNKLFTYDCTIDVADIDKAIDLVKSNGGQITSEKMKIENVGWFARGIDTEGNTFGLMQSTRT